MRLRPGVAAGIACAPVLLAAAGGSGCEHAYPEVVIVNTTAAHIVLRDVSFNGCLWKGVLSYGEATAPQRCPPGADRVRFKRFDVAEYCSEHAADPICAGQGAAGVPEEDGSAPMWFSYQTVTAHEVSYSDFERIEIRLTDMEQDFTVAGPYGH